MSAEHDALVEAWKTQRAEWLDGMDRPTIAVARSWFTAGWADCGKWQASRPVTDGQAPAEVEWGVYAESEGQFYSVTPATHENAEREAGLVGAGHRPVTAQRGRELRNAWSHGRMSEVEKQRTEANR